MKRMAMLAVALIGMSFAGCGDPWRGDMPTESEQIALAAAGYPDGNHQLLNMKKITGRAVVTVYDDDGIGRVRGQNFTANLPSGRIKAEGVFPGGTWRGSASVDGNSSVSSSGDGSLSDGQKQEIGDYLRLIIHRMRGPVNLLRRGGEDPGQVESLFQSGHPMMRVLSCGREDMATAYFFDKKTCRLRMMSTGDYELPGEGTVTLYEYARTASGVLLPKSLEVVALGPNSFVGSRKIVSVSFECLEIH